ncbi:hypothetical protein [Deinococcus sp. UR1]|uniref:hypothetical protein n=1 Tax=Deinococcus sp. UR1 TaxID=1704277 RepID=UPI000C179937|nr:hypothetical protein [Deinococcus sp. UR1]PIG96883.1 hypothetical protein AMD26_015255 [Deinococcus sp. UR1]
MTTEVPSTPGNIAIIDVQEFTEATTRRVGRRTFTQPIELPSGTLTGEPNHSGDGTRVAISYPWTEEDRYAIWEMFLTLTWAWELPEDWATAQFTALAARAPTN